MLLTSEEKQNLSSLIETTDAQAHLAALAGNFTAAHALAGSIAVYKALATKLLQEEQRQAEAAATAAADANLKAEKKAARAKARAEKTQGAV